ncbi:MAG: nuclear transport factor 2 family protein [Crocosphaera sp.]|nr:nuclear transport factor 2 family protein [Crocosphaera sp.]
MANVITGLVVTTPVITLAQPSNSPLLIAQEIKQLDEEMIRQAMEAINQAENREDIDAMLKFLAPFSISEITVEYKGNILTTNLEGINAHRRMLKNTFALVKEREILNDYMTVRITPDGKIATVTRVIFENLTTKDEQKFMVSGTDILRFALIDNQPKIISVKSQGWLEPKPTE